MDMDAKRIFFTQTMATLERAYVEYRHNNKPEGVLVLDGRELYLDFLGMMNEVLAFGWDLGQTSTGSNPFEIAREDRGVMDAPGVMKSYLEKNPIPS